MSLPTALKHVGGEVTTEGAVCIYVNLNCMRRQTGRHVLYLAALTTTIASIALSVSAKLYPSLSAAVMNRLVKLQSAPHE